MWLKGKKKKKKKKKSIMWMTEQNWMVSLCFHIKVLLIRPSCVIWSNMFCCTVQIDGRERFFKRTSLNMLFKDRVYSWTSWTFSGKLMFKKVWSDPCCIQSSYLIWPLFHSVFLSYLTLVSFSLPILFDPCFIQSSYLIWPLFHSSFLPYFIVFMCCLILCFSLPVSFDPLYFGLPVLSGPCFIQSSSAIWPVSQFSCVIWPLFQFSCVIWRLFQY